MASSRPSLKDIVAKPHMVNWFDPRRLAETGLRDMITRVFGQYADQRMMQATIDGFTPQFMQDVVKRYDYQNEPGFEGRETIWIDYAADTGDGFDSTFAIASLIAADSLDVEGAGKLPGGKILILGGDQVYPFPTRWDYQNRFIDPFAYALPGNPIKEHKRDMYALPGNHDWYDGLNSFDNVFCKSRFVPDGQKTTDNRIGGWRCPQHRSYWSIRLPHDWWIWGADIQLSQYLDAGQVLYFRRVAKEMASLKTGTAKLIMCIAEPSWYQGNRGERAGESNLDSVINIALDEGAKVCAILTGDVHHYSRYQAKDLGLNLITAGGGGAYFSPTHPLKDKLELEFAGAERPYDLTLFCKRQPDGTETEACWPPRTQSRRLSFRILGFPIRNYGFSVALGVIYWLMVWGLSGTEVEYKKQTHAIRDWFFPTLANPDVYEAPINPLTSFWDYVLVTLNAGVANPILGLVTMAILFVLIGYADSPGKPVRKFLMGFAHWAGHLTMAVLLYFLLRGLSESIPLRVGEIYNPIAPEGWKMTPEFMRFVHYLLFPLLMWFIGGLFAGAVWGTYLTISSFFRRHCDEAFSSMRITDFRHFLRLKIEPDKLTIYPIGLKNVPSRGQWRLADLDRDGVLMGPELVPPKPFKPVLIDEPIVIDPNKVRGRDPLTRQVRKLEVASNQ